MTYNALYAIEHNQTKSYIFNMYSVDLALKTYNGWYAIKQNQPTHYRTYTLGKCINSPNLPTQTSVKNYQLTLVWKKTLKRLKL